MLQQFTWQTFLVAAMVLTLIWYAGVILIFYRKELNTFLNGRKYSRQPDEPLPHRWENGTEQMDDENEEAILGRSQLPEGLTTVNMGGFGFVQNEDAKEQQVGLVPDVLGEVKSVFSIIAKEDGNKNDFFGLMRLVREKYPKIGSNSNIGYINEFIADHAPFHLSSEELEDLWD